MRGPSRVMHGVACGLRAARFPCVKSLVSSRSAGSGFIGHIIGVDLRGEHHLGSLTEPPGIHGDPAVLSLENCQSEVGNSGQEPPHSVPNDFSQLVFFFHGPHMTMMFVWQSLEGGPPTLAYGSFRCGRECILWK